MSFKIRPTLRKVEKLKMTQSLPLKCFSFNVKILQDSGLAVDSMESPDAHFLNVFLFTLKALKMDIVEFANSREADEAAHNELTHLIPFCFPSCL